ncbi:MAG: hypothetical protein SVU32_01435, partial [Candidatus Nanohaloarchaea archaeon]|nr:hypothetical protein [Candidatus Nanohaloarchaea archaeon]
DVFVGAERSFKVAEYEIELDGREERHKNSGMIVSTGRGSTGWYKNILKQRLQTGISWLDTWMSPLYERVADRLYTFDPEADELRSVEREPMQSAGDSLTQCRLQEGDELTVTSKMNVEGVITFDGDEEDRMYDFPRGESVSFKIADRPLSVIRRT